MKLYNLKRSLMVSAFGLIALLGITNAASAQTNRRERQQQQKVERQQQRIYSQQQRIEQERLQLAQQRQLEQQRRLEQQRNRNRRDDSIYSNNNGYSNNNRYRVYRNGSYYQTDNRGAELLRQAVNAGYQQGYQAGRSDRSRRRSSSYNSSSIYRSGNYGYQSYVDSSQYQYYFQQGFQRGYQDGYDSRYQYGSYNNGSLNILGTILQGILNIQQF